MPAWEPIDHVPRITVLTSMVNQDVWTFRELGSTADPIATRRRPIHWNARYFLAGLWEPDAQSASAPGSAVIAHGTSISGAARLTIFAMNPLYRADPEREWAMLASTACWGDQ